MENPGHKKLDESITNMGLRTKVVHCKKEAYEVYIGRPSKWGNPFSHHSFGTLAKFVVDTREDAVAEFEKYIKGKPSLLRAIKRELRGKVLGCWCRPNACHGDILARIADQK